MDTEVPNLSKRLLHLQIRDLDTLRAVYMPYLRNGGLYLPLAGNHELGDRFFLVLTLPGESSAMALVVRVVWLAPNARGAGEPVRGIGVQFCEGEHPVRRRIELYLSAAPPGEATHAAM